MRNTAPVNRATLRTANAPALLEDSLVVDAVGRN